MGLNHHLKDWLLDSVAIGSYPICILNRNDVNMILNKPSHGATFSQLLETLYFLFLNEKIIASRLGEDYLFLPSQQEIAIALAGNDSNLDYQLTEKGGACWESRRKPDWSRYYYDSFGVGDDGENELTICANDPAVIHEYLSIQHYIWGVSIVKDSCKWSILRPWRATNWKYLPIGYEVMCKTKNIESEEDLKLLNIESRSSLTLWPQEVLERFTSLRNWYNKQS